MNYTLKQTTTMVSQSDVQSVLMKASSIFSSNTCLIVDVEINSSVATLPLWAIQNGKITITPDTSGAADASYVSLIDAKGRENAIIVNPTFTMASVDDQALFIHECVHAAFDVAAILAGKKIIIKAMISESAAYVAQCIFLLKNNITTISSPKAQKIFDAALVIASAAVNGSKNSFAMGDEELMKLMNALKSNPLYKKAKTYEYDGV